MTDPIPEIEAALGSIKSLTPIITAVVPDTAAIVALEPIAAEALTAIETLKSTHSVADAFKTVGSALQKIGATLEQAAQNPIFAQVTASVAAKSAG